MCLLFETIIVKNGSFCNLRYHSERMNDARRILLHSSSDIDLQAMLSVTESSNTGVFRCRVDYGIDIQKTIFTPYQIRKIETLQMVIDNEIDYQLKYTDRARFEEMKSKSKANEILIVKNEFITDTSFSNIIFFDWENKWVTPTTPLLKGTKRKELLEKGMIHEKEIRPYDLKDFTKARLINAMLDMEDGEEIEIGNIFF